MFTPRDDMFNVYSFKKGLDVPQNCRFRGGLKIEYDFYGCSCTVKCLELSKIFFRYKLSSTSEIKIKASKFHFSLISAKGRLIKVFSEKKS